MTQHTKMRNLQVHRMGSFTWQEGARISKNANVKKFFIFHHNPDNKDNDMKIIEDESKLFDDNIVVAKEGMCVKI